MSIVIEDLVKRFQGATIVDSVSVEIEKGELFVLLGASGSGKSFWNRFTRGSIRLPKRPPFPCCSTSTWRLSKATPAARHGAVGGEAGDGAHDEDVVLLQTFPEGEVFAIRVSRPWRHEFSNVGGDLAPAGAAEKVSGREFEMAEQLIEAMSGDWQPEKYRDEYREDLLKLIDNKIKRGQAKTIEPMEAPEAARKPSGKVIDIMHLLKQSVDQQRRKTAPQRQRRAG